MKRRKKRNEILNYFVYILMYKQVLRNFSRIHWQRVTKTGIHLATTFRTCFLLAMQMLGTLGTLLNLHKVMPKIISDTGTTLGNSNLAGQLLSY